MIKKEAYQKLSDMIYKGFLTSTLNVSGKSFVFKTVNEKEYDLIKLYTGMKDKNYALRLNHFFMLFSFLLIDNENVLRNRENKISVLYDYVLNLPSMLYSRISDELSDLRRKAEEIIDFLEGFSYTEQSRRVWRIIRGNLPTSEKFTGISGTSALGLNVYQENWMLINRMLDEEEEYNKDFSMAVLIASAHNPKGARNIGSKHDALNQRNKERRTKLAREGSSERQKWKPTGWAASVDTAEELVDELMRQMSGKKDKHDLFIERHLKNLHERANQQVKEAEEKLEMIRKRRQLEGGPSIQSSQRILSEEESKELMSRKSDKVLIIPNRAERDEQARFLKKVGSRMLTARK